MALTLRQLAIDPARQRQGAGVKRSVQVMGTQESIELTIENANFGPTKNRSYTLLHGITSDQDEYLGLHRIIAERLAREGFSNVRFDFGGHGSRAKQWSALTLNRMVSETATAVRYLASESTSQRPESAIFGTSFGGPPAIITAALLPDLVSRLVLLAPVSDYRALYLDPSSDARKQNYRGMLDQALKKRTPFALGDGLFLSADLVFELATIDVVSLMRRVRCPVTILHGTEDEVVPFQLSEILASANAHAELIALANTDHGFTAVGDESGQHPVTLQNVDTIMSALIA